MTNYNERIDEILVDNFEEIRVIGCTVESIDRRIAEAKQAITLLIKGLVAEAKPKTTPFDNNLDGGYATDIRNSAIDQFEQNLLKALEEV